MPFMAQYVDNTRATITLPSGLTTIAFPYSNLAPSIAPERLISIHTITVVFPPCVEITPGAVVDCQMQITDPVSANIITLDTGRILSTVSPKRATVRIPMHFQRYFSSSDTSHLAFSILFNNTGAGITITALVKIKFYLAAEPNKAFTPRILPSGEQAYEEELDRQLDALTINRTRFSSPTPIPQQTRRH